LRIVREVRVFSYSKSDRANERIDMPNRNASVIFPRGEMASSSVFLGTAWMKMLVSDAEGVYDCQVYDVVFEPGARNHWHSHPGGQILLVTDGTGYYQERGKAAQRLRKGDVVQIPPDMEHWHGAAPNSGLTHIGISANAKKGAATWFGPVTNEEYETAMKMHQE
jgi:quercetin dioxygenase-like cupin family protein